jgi:hypothetical protein
VVRSAHIEADGDATLYGWYIPFAGEPLLSGSGLPEVHSIPPRALGTPVACTPPFAVSTAHLSDSLVTIKTVTAFQIQTSIILSPP